MAELTAAAHGGWDFGVRIQGTQGAEGSSKMGLSADAPRIHLDAPPDGSLLAATPAAVTGTVQGTDVAVDVNGVAPRVAGTVFDAEVPLVEGASTLLATAANALGTATDAVQVVLDTMPPAVAITDPPDGALTAEAEALVRGTVADASSIASFTMNGAEVPLVDGTFRTMVPLAPGSNPIEAVAVDAAGHPGSDAIAVVRGEPPAVAITSPVEGARVAPGILAVTGTVTGLPEPMLVVNGVAASVTGGTFSAEVSLTPGPHTVTATATNALGSASAQLRVTAGVAPGVAITAPADGLLTRQSPVTVSGTVTGTAPLTVAVNGVAAAVSGGSFSASVPLAEGVNRLTATASNLFGSASDGTAVTLDTTPPVVTILAPADGSELTEGAVGVFGSVTDASPIVALTLNGAMLPAGTAFDQVLPLAEGPNPIVVAATDAAGNTGSASVTVTLRTSEPLTISITSPPEGALVSAERITVSGTVSDPTALVSVQGVTATVTGHRYIAPGVSLAEGPNPLLARATRPGASASATSTVVFNAPPNVVITSPPDGAVVSGATLDVAGQVDDPTAFVDVNGVVARVGSAGRFLAPAVPLDSGANLLTARAIDPFGAQGSDAASVIRDEASGPAIRVGLAAQYDFAGEADGDPHSSGLNFVAFGDDQEFLEGMVSTGASPASFDPPVTGGQVGIGLWVYVLSATADPVSVELVFADDGSPVEFQDVVSQGAVPIEDLGQSLLFRQSGDVLNPEVFQRQDIQVGYVHLFFSHFGIPPGQEFVVPQSRPMRVIAMQGAVTDTLDVTYDPQRPGLTLESPADGSVIGGNAVTVTGSVAEETAIYRVLYTVESEHVVIDEGSAQTVDGRFTIPDLFVPEGESFVEISVIDVVGNEARQGIFLTADPAAPAVSVFPPDGVALQVDSAAVSLNFSAPTTLVGVNGTPDGRSFPAGLAEDVLGVLLVFGANRIDLQLDAGGGVFDFSFTYFRVDALSEIRITSPLDESYVNTEMLEVEGRVPRGTPFVEVNGIPATIAPDGVSFQATIPIPRSTGIEDRNGDVVPRPFEISAVALPTNAADAIQVRPDFGAPEFRIVLPGDGEGTLDPEVAYGGWVSEPALVSVEIAGEGSAVRTLRDRVREREEVFNLFSVKQFHRFDMVPLPVALGENAVTLRAVDRAGNVSQLDLSLLRFDAALQLVEPTAPVPDLVTDVSLDALEEVVLDAVFAAGRLLPAFSGLSIPAGGFTLGGVPLVPGPNELRIVYRQPGGPQQVLHFTVESASAEPAIATGTVTDSETGAPVGGALVRLTVGGSTLVTATDPDGSFRAVVEPGLLEGEVRAEGFVDASFQGTIGVGETLVADLDLAPAGTDLPPPAAGAFVLLGTLLDEESGQPVAGVQVDLVGLPLAANTDARGAFLLDGVPLGEQVLRFRREGSLDEFQSLDVPFAPAGSALSSTFTLRFEGGLAATLAVDPQAPGRVLDRLTSQPVSGARVEARLVPTGELLGATVAGADGSFVLGGLPPFATVEFVASGPDHRDASVTALIVPRGEEILDLRLRSTREGSLAGSVRDTVTGEPLAVAEVRIGGGAVLATLSDRDGGFELVGVTPGIYEVLVRHPAYFEAVLADVEVRADTTTPLDAALVPRPTTGGLQGVVRDAATGAPVAGATLTGPGGASSVTGPDGSYSLSGLPAGLISLTVAATGYPTATRTAVVDADLDATTPTARRADFELARDGSFRLEATAPVPMSGGALELPDGSVRLDFPPLALSGDAVVTLRRPASVALAPGAAVALDPKLGESGLLGAGEAVEITLEAAVPGDPAPVFVGPVVLSMRYAAADAAASHLFEDGLVPLYFDADQGHWTLPRTVPYLHGVDRVNRRVATAISLILTETGDPITAQLRTAQPVRLAGFPGLPVIRPIRNFVVGLFAKVDSDNPLVRPAFAMHFMDPGDFDLLEPQEEKEWTRNARPVLFFHGWDPKATLFNVDAMTREEVKASRYSDIMEDVVNATDGVYRPIFPSYNTRQGIEALGGRVAAGVREFDEELRGVPADPDDPASGATFPHFDAFGFSMGGLIERAYQREAKGSRRSVNAMVTMGTPHHGGLQQVRRAVDGVLGAAVGLAAIPGLEALLGVWSPGTNDLLDYSDTVCAVLPELSGNASLCRLNRDTGSAPNERLSLVAGRDPNSLFDLYDGFLSVFGEGRFRSALQQIADFIRDPEFFGADLNPLDELASEGFLSTGCLRSDGVVCVWSAHAREGPGGPRVVALADVVAKTPSERDFDHHRAGTGDQRIQPYVDEDVIAILSDWFVGKHLQETQFVAPTRDQEGAVVAQMGVEWNLPQGSIEKLALVVYGGYLDEHGQLQVKILAGADENGVPEPGSSLDVAGNSAGRGMNPLLIDTAIPRVDPVDPSTRILVALPFVIPIGPSQPRVPPVPPEEGGFAIRPPSP